MIGIMGYWGRMALGLFVVVGCTSEATHQQPPQDGGLDDASVEGGADAGADTSTDGPATDATSDATGDAADGGECSVSCPQRPNATVDCVNGTCVITSCDVGWDDCNDVLLDGCEVFVAGDTSNCGVCAKVCAGNNGTVACTSGTCLVSTCTSGYADCNSTGDDGCETSLQVPATCGSCNDACASGQLCDASGPTPVCALDCGSQTLCGATCANTQTDAQHCGGCGNACTGPNASHACDSGQCAIASCASGFLSCDGSASTGCETNVLTSSAHCGACGQSCSGTCVGGACNPVVSLSMGPYNACALRHDGQVLCWGLNDEGGIGDGTRLSRAAPTPVPGVTAKSVGVAENVVAACAVDTTGKLWCWGRNRGGAVGDGTLLSPRVSPTAVTSNDPQFATRVFEVVDGFAEGFCALDDQGDVWCWGYSQLGTAGSGVVGEIIPRATRVSGVAGAIALSAAPLHVCALIQGGTVRCWGRGTNGELGDGQSQTSVSPVTVSGLSGIQKIAAGESASCAIDGVGDLYCWGRNSSGAVGDGTTTVRPTPVKSSLTAVQQVGMGRHHVLARTASGAFGWGNNTLGQLLTATPSAQEPTPLAVTGLPAGATDFYGGSGSMCVLHGGAASCWGHDWSGQLGVRDVLVKTLPFPIGGATPLGGLGHIALGGNHSCVALAQEVRCGGLSINGQLVQSVVGDATAVPLAMPLPTSPVRSLTGGTRFSCAVIGADGSREAWCWGLNAAFSLGTTAAGSGPHKVMNLTDPSVVVAGGEFACALVAGVPHCWGANGLGQLGIGATTPSTSLPGPVSGVTDAVAVTAGELHACVLHAGGTVSCWGANGNGQLGIGATGTQTAPVLLSTLTGVKQIAAGGRFTCAIVGASDEVRCWGGNDSGQLGNGNTTNQGFPQPAVLGGAVALSGGGQHTCAVLADGTVRCWGDNGSGQLGNGTRTSSLTPVTVTGLSDATTVSTYRVPIPYGHSTCARRQNGTAVCWGMNSYGRLLGGESILVPTSSPVAFP